MLSLKNILVPVDFSKGSELALAWAVKLSKEEKGAKIFLFHVITPVPFIENGAGVETMIQAVWDNAAERMKEWRAQIPPPIQCETLIGTGNTLAEILDVCAKQRIDLIVMTTQGRHGISRALQPNLTEKVVRDAPCPVLALHLNSKIEANLADGRDAAT